MCSKKTRCIFKISQNIHWPFKKVDSNLQLPLVFFLFISRFLVCTTCPHSAPSFGQADPSFSVLRAVYPVALRRLLTNPSDSPRLAATLDAIAHGHPSDQGARAGVVSGSDAPRSSGTPPLLLSPRPIKWRALLALGSRAARLLGVPRRKLLCEALQVPGGRRFARRLAREQLALWAHHALATLRLWTQKTNEYPLLPSPILQAVVVLGAPAFN